MGIIRKIVTRFTKPQPEVPASTTLPVAFYSGNATEDLQRLLNEYKSLCTDASDIEGQEFTYALQQHLERTCV